MHLMLRKAAAENVRVHREDFLNRGKAIGFFPGVESWFGQINAYARSQGVTLKHYLISSGNEEIFRGTPIAEHFEAVFASKYLFDENGVPQWPALAINYTTKTQFLFRINKGVRDISDNNAVNKYLPKNERPVPFEHMAFIGDGMTDIPCFRLLKDQGGLSVAVYAPRTKGAEGRAAAYLKDGRVHAVARADYRQGRELDQLIKAKIDEVASRHALNSRLRALNKESEKTRDAQDESEPAS